MIKAVVFDLDDTLFPEREYVASGFAAVSEAVEAEHGISGAKEEFCALFAENKEGVFDRFCEKHNLDGQAAKKMTELYRGHAPDISLHDEIKSVLKELKNKGYKLGIVTDGRPNGQRKKIEALGLSALVDEIIITDELGGKEFRKPNPTAFEKMSTLLGVPLDQMMYVGDNPKKDFAIGAHGVTTVRLKGDGIYEGSDYLDGIKENYAIDSFDELSRVIGEADGEEKAFVHGKLLDIMDFVHGVCAAEGIEYSLSGGTMLGAVRHKGFIPWDDDMDIIMRREQFDRFDAVIRDYCERDGRFVYNTDRRVPIVGYRETPTRSGKRYNRIKVDIFFLDNFPDKKSKRRRLLFRIRTLQGMLHKGKLNWKKYDLKGKILLIATRALGAFRSSKGLLKSYRKLSTSYNAVPTRQMFISNDLYAVLKVPYDREWFDGASEMPFEDRRYLVFDAYDKILTYRYGDYMTPPPEKERVFKHVKIERATHEESK
ncbi:MAG: HAD-IA family hydrolase [Clostridiales bacterium]|nr:HAD-IA family hydrolase [Clostridiales bacterium]